MATVVLCQPEEPAGLLSAALRAGGHEAEHAADGHRAIQVVERGAPDAVVIQMGLAGPPPVEMLERIRRAAPDARILCLLETNDPESAADLLRAGADGLLLPEETAPGYVAWAVDQVLRGGAVLSPLLAADLTGRFADAVGREREFSRSLARVSQQAENLANAKAEFLSNLSHELRTPLTVIKGVAQVVTRFGGKDEEQTGMLSKLEDAATKLTRMVENLLTLAEMERGEFRLNLADVDMASVVRRSAEEMGAKYPNVQVDLRIPASIPARADGERLSEVMRHIVDNACRYSEEGGTVTVTAKKAVEGVIVTVVDHGKGVDRAIVAQAFGEAFTTGEATLTKQRAGLGLGLNLARNLVVHHGGILSAEPMPGGGSKVTMVIPPEPAEPEPATGAEAEEAPVDEPGAEVDPLEQLRELQRKLAESEARAQEL